uniref:Uncharacterized protein n=1 Tax=Fervidobacterium pennivorans TaxID=93466 RepID=A0A7V4KBZ8_FERPE
MSLLGVSGRRLLMGLGALGVVSLLGNRLRGRETKMVQSIGRQLERIRQPEPEQPSEIEILKSRIEAATDVSKYPHLTEFSKQELLRKLEEGKVQEVKQILEDIERRQMMQTQKQQRRCL